MQLFERAHLYLPNPLAADAIAIRQFFQRDRRFRQPALDQDIALTLVQRCHGLLQQGMTGFKLVYLGIIAGLIAVFILQPILPLRCAVAIRADHHVQRCIATGEPVAETIDTPFAIRFLREEDEIASGDEMELDADEVDTVSFSGESIDMGEAVAETLALSVDPYPRRPDADEWLRKMGVMNEEQASPFAMLAKLKAR